MKKRLCLLIASLISTMALAQSVSIGDILCTDGTTVKPAAFPSSGKTAEGIVFYVDQNGQEGWAVNLNCDAININWVSPEHYEEGYDIPILPNHETSRSALFDLDGYSNTAAIRMTNGPEWYPAAWSVDFDNGWYLPSFMTPETKWGYDAVNSVHETPDESWKWIDGQIRQFYPDAGEKEIRKVMGVRR